MEFRLSKGHFLGLFCAVVWGATFISTKVLLEYLSPLQILFSRFLLGYIALWCLYPHRSPKYGRKAQLLFALAGFLGTFLYFLMENVALQHTTASNVGVLVSLAPLFTAAVSKLENPKLTLSLQLFVGAVLSFVGVLLIVFGDNMSLVINPLGDTLALGAAFVWALYSIVLNKLSVYKAPILVSTRTIFGYGLIFIVAGVLYADDFPGSEILLKTEVWSNLIFLGFIACAARYSMWTMAVETIGPDRTALYLYLVPVICLVCSYLILGENLTAWSAAGTFLVLFGLILSQLDSSSLKKRIRKASEIS
ncbi:DMT family transporter [Parasutterella sp.]|uniref:DMT family transporter n=1 Tax=Parasutterella sp. TaxID=2049037 RepID=UPI003AF0D6CD